MKNLIKKYPNDLELGRAVRKQYLERGDEAVELLKEVLALHGQDRYSYSTDLGQAPCDREVMEEVDKKIKEYLEKIE